VTLHDVLITNYIYKPNGIHEAVAA